MPAGGNIEIAICCDAEFVDVFVAPASKNRTSSRLFAPNREISVCVRLRGGAGRTRTTNQTIISRQALSIEHFRRGYLKARNGLKLLLRKRRCPGSARIERKVRHEGRGGGDVAAEITDALRWIVCHCRGPFIASQNCVAVRER
jgi:hypothetical protein